MSGIVALLKQLFTTFFIVPIFQMKDKHFNKHQSIDENILNKDDSFNDVKNPILTASIEYLISTKRFDASLYQNWQSICLCAIYF